MSASFSQFLLEKHQQNNAALIILQKIIDMVDDGHVDYSSDNIKINIGKLIKDSNLYDLTMIIRGGRPHNIRLAKDADDKFAIVVDTSKLPSRENIDKFLSRKENTEKFNREFSKYLKNHHVAADERGVEKATAYEKTKQYSNRNDFEKNYNEIISSVKTKIEEYKKAKADIEKQLEQTGSPAQAASLKMAIDHLKNDYFGNSSSEFASKALKDAGEFKDHLTPELKKKMMTRLQDFYEHLDK